MNTLYSMERKWELWNVFLYSLRDEEPFANSPGRVPEWFYCQDEIYRISEIQELIDFYKSDKLCLGMQMDREEARRKGELKRFREHSR